MYSELPNGKSKIVPHVAQNETLVLGANTDFHALVAILQKER